MAWVRVRARAKARARATDHSVRALSVRLGAISVRAGANTRRVTARPSVAHRDAELREELIERALPPG